jgi:threonine dehydrogenase-like Zn-dependent dehydrogenase
VVFDKPGQVAIEERPDPAPAVGEVLIRVRRCGIRGRAADTCSSACRGPT